MHTPPCRLGLLVPSTNTVMEPDFYRRLPAGWSLHTARMLLDAVTPEAEARMLDEYALPAAHSLAGLRPDVVVFGCTSAGALRGNAFEAELVRRLSAQCGAPVVSVAQAVRQQMRELGARRWLVLTPYVDALNGPIRASLEADGLEVAALAGLGISDNTQIAAVPPEVILEGARVLVQKADADALFVSCTNFPAFDLWEALSQVSGLPVVTSNQAALQAALAAV